MQVTTLILICSVLLSIELAALIAVCRAFLHDFNELRQYVDNTVNAQGKSMLLYTDRAVAEVNGEISKLKEGCCPDFEKAQDAVRAINNMNEGICNILGFDPMEAMRKIREEER